jgi:hypothetical protein
MAQDAADKAHEEKVERTADGERLVEHSAFTDGDRDLRALQDHAEAERVDAYRETGYVAGPNTGDYHAVRRAAKQAGAILGVVGGAGELTDDPSAAVLNAGVRDMVEEDVNAAAQARRAAGGGRRSPQGRRSRSEAMAGGTGGLSSAGGEGSGKSASSTGTDSDDRQMDASAPADGQPPSVGNKPQDSDQSRPSGTKSASSSTVTRSPSRGRTPWTGLT